MTIEKNKLENFFKSLGELIAIYRKENGYSLEELGLSIGLDRSAMHRIENGKPINVTTIVKLSLALNKEPRDFFDIDFNFKPAELGGLVKSKKSSKSGKSKETKKADEKTKKDPKKRKQI